MFRKRRVSTLLATVACAALALSACGSSNSALGVESGTPVAGGTVVDLQNFAAGDPDHIDPALTADNVQSAQIADLLYDGLTKTDNQGNAQNAVAQSVTANANSTIWTFRLRSDVTFSNGDPVLPSDFKFAWERVFNPVLNSPDTSFFSLIQGADAAPHTGVLSGVIADDSTRTLTVNLIRPAQDFPSQVSLPVFSPLPMNVFTTGRLKDPSFDTNWENTMMIGDGAFKMKSAWQHGKEIDLLRSETYYGGFRNQKAYLNEVDFRISQDINSAFTDFSAGNGDIGRIPAGEYQKATSTFGKDAINNSPLMGTEYWAFNMTDPTVGGSGNALLRQAINLAINKADIVNKVYNGSRQVATGWAAPSTPGFLPSSAQPTNVDKAKELLQQWGKTSPVIKVSFNAGAGHDEKAAIIVQNLKDVGINAVADPLDLQSFIAAERAGTLQFFRGAYNADFASYDNYLYPLFSSHGDQNAFNYDSPTFDSLLTRAQVESSTDQRDSLYRQAEAQMLSDQVVIPIDWTTASLVTSSRVHGLSVLPNAYVAYDQVWVK